MATLRSSVAAPASIVSLLIFLVYEKPLLSFIIAPFTPLSLNNVLDPAPRIVIFNSFFLISSKISFSCCLSLALKKNSAFPPRLNQL